MADLTGFEIARRGQKYVIHFNMDEDSTVEIVASYEQMDLIAEEIDRQLDRDSGEELEIAGGHAQRGGP